MTNKKEVALKVDILEQILSDINEARATPRVMTKVVSMNQASPLLEAGAKLADAEELIMASLKKMRG